VVACQMLHRTNLLALVNKHASRTVSILDSKTGTPLCKPLQFVSLVVRLELNQLFLCVLCNDGKLSVYDIETLALLKTLIVSGGTIRTNVFVGQGCYFDMTPVATKDTTSGTHPCWIVCQTPTRGELNVYDRKLKLVERLTAFEANVNVGLMAVGGSGSQQFLAVAEDQGCVIRILSLPSGQPTHSLYRGSKPCQLFSISFHINRTGTSTPSYAAVSGDTGTVHVFRLDVTATGTTNDVDDGADANQIHEPTPNDGLLTQMLPLSNLLSMLPLPLSPQNRQRSICKVKLEREASGMLPWNSVLLNSTEFDTDPSQGLGCDLTLAVASSSGSLVRYRIRDGISELVSTELLLS